MAVVVSMCLKPGDILICTHSKNPFWTKGRTYVANSNGLVCSDTGTPWFMNRDDVPPNVTFDKQR